MLKKDFFHKNVDCQQRDPAYNQMMLAKVNIDGESLVLVGSMPDKFAWQAEKFPASNLEESAKAILLE